MHSFAFYAPARAEIDERVRPTVSVERLGDGSVRVLLKRPGANGFQAISKVVSAGGETKTVQIVVNASGKITHYDPK